MNDASKDGYAIFQMESLEDVVREVEKLLFLMFPRAAFADIRSSVENVVALYNGKYPGYKACSTYYHDFSHIRDTLLAMARLIHGAWLDGEIFSERMVYIGLTAALFHDAGYIQEHSDYQGTGAKFTKIHIPRSMDMFGDYGGISGMSAEEIAEGRAMIACTDISKDIPKNDFLLPEGELLGRILTMADVLAQMSDRVYLEKLLFLYHEFEEGEFGDYSGEEDLLRKTIWFFDFVMDYMRKTLSKTDDYLKLHFLCRWGIDRNLYDRAINRHKEYLQKILKLPDNELWDCLKRSGIVEKVRKLYPRKSEPDGGSDG
jgi:hypothetical protein